MITVYSYNIAEGTMEKPPIEDLPKLFESEDIDF